MGGHRLLRDRDGRYRAVRRHPRRHRHHDRAHRCPDFPHELDHGTKDPILPPRASRPHDHLDQGHLLHAGASMGGRTTRAGPIQGSGTL